MNYPDSAQAVASFQYNKHFLSVFSQGSSRWARVTLPAGVGGKELSHPQLKAEWQVLFCLQMPGSPGDDEGRSPKRASPLLLPSFDVACALCSQALIWMAPCSPLPFPLLSLCEGSLT